MPTDKTSTLPLLLGSYVEVEIEGRRAGQVIELERTALRDGNQVYVFTPEATLEIRKVEVLWRWTDTVLLSAGLEAGEKVIVSPVASAVEGMKLRVPSTESAPARETARPADTQPSKAGTAGVPADKRDGTSL